MSVAEQSGRQPGPRWLTGDWGRVVRDPSDLLRLAFLVGIPVVLVAGPRVEGLRLALTFGVCLIARIAATPAPFDFAFCAAMSLQAWGNVGGAFDAWLPYHDVVHLVLTMATAALFYFVLLRLRLVPDLAEEARIHQRIGIATLTFAIGTMVGAVYEEYEWFAINVLGSTITEYYTHDIHDLFFNGLGSIAAGLLLGLWSSRGWGTRRPSGGDPLRGVLRWIERKAETDDAPSVGSRRVRPPVRPKLPRALAGDWTAAVREPIDLLRLSFLVGALVDAAMLDGEGVLRFGLTFLVVLGARWVQAPRPFDLLFCVAMAFQAWGSYAGAFDSVAGYEAWTHFVVSLAFAGLLYLALVRLRVLPDLAEEPRVHRRIAVFLAAMSLGYCVGVYYELYVYVADHWLGGHFGVTWDGLTRRLGLDWLGAGVGGAVMVLWDVYGWGTTRRLPAPVVATA